MSRITMGGMKITPQSDTKQCKQCGRTFIKSPTVSRKRWNIGVKYCSKKCSNLAKLGIPSWNTGMTIDRTKYPNFGHFTGHTTDSKQKMKAALDNWKLSVGEEVWREKCREGQKNSIEVGIKNGSYHGTLGKKGSLSYVWLGDNATYNSKHRWIQKNWIKTGICHRCGIKARPYGKCLSGTHWHNIKKEYDRDDTSGWVELCPKCHLLTHKEECS